MDKKEQEEFNKFLRDKGNPKTEKKKIYEFLKERTNVQKILINTALIVAFIFLITKTIGTLSSTTTSVWVYIALLSANIITALWLLNKVGLAVAILPMLGILMKWGVVEVLGLIYITAIIMMFMATRSTPIDFAISKDAYGAVTMSIYQTIWVLIMAPVVSFLGNAYILSHLTVVYMFATMVYVILMVIFLPLLAREPLPAVMINGLVMIVVEYLQLYLIGAWFFAYILSI